jgi:hypothetical protein
LLGTPLVCIAVAVALLGSPAIAAAFTITASAGSGGSIAPAGNVTVATGANQTFTITPGAGHHIADAAVDGGSVGPVGSYTFTNVTSDHTIAASFAIDGDDCGSVIALGPLPATHSGTTVGAADDFHCGGNVSPDVVFSFVTSPNDTMWAYIVSLCTSSYPTRLEVRTGGTCPGSTQIACTDSGCFFETGSGSGAYLTLTLAPSTQYFVIVDGAHNAGDAGSYTLDVDKWEIHPNDPPLCARPCDY